MLFKKGKKSRTLELANPTYLKKSMEMSPLRKSPSAGWFYTRV